MTLKLLVTSINKNYFFILLLEKLYVDAEFIKNDKHDCPLELAIMHVTNTQKIYIRSTLNQHVFRMKNYLLNKKIHFIIAKKIYME